MEKCLFTMPVHPSYNPTFHRCQEYTKNWFQQVPMLCGLHELTPIFSSQQISIWVLPEQ